MAQAFEVGCALQTAVGMQDSGAVDETLDVLVIGAGLSGISAAYHLKTLAPDKTWAIVEARDAIGGTWDLFRYPGIRSDSDMFTFGYAFHPWRGDRSFADGPSIKAYIEETAETYGIRPHIRFRHRVTGLSWSSEHARWTATLQTENGTRRIAASFVFACTGYYAYGAGHTPSWPGMEDFAGRIVHPQHWPEDLDVTGRRVVVVGSGATAVTLVPALAEKAAHVTMLQRSPTWVVGRPLRDAWARRFQRVLPARLAHRLARVRNIGLTIGYFELARRLPERFGNALLERAQEALGPSVPVDPHFKPDYAPWDQRLCLAPDGDLFDVLRSGRASVVTDTLERFTEDGLVLGSGETLEADLVVTATGLVVRLFDGVELEVDGQVVQLSDTLAYKGCMYSGVPNLVSAFGYTNASWTLKVDLTAAWTARLLGAMDARGATVAVPRHDASQPRRPLIDFSSGYVKRALGNLPSQGGSRPWRVHQNYLLDLLELRYGPLDDGVLDIR